MEKEIAIIGVAGRFPRANHIHAFYQNLRHGRDCVQKIDERRLRNTSIPEGNYQLMGYLDDIDQFDYKFFNLSKAEAELMDPHQRIMLEVVHEALENAGYNTDDFSGTRTNVYASCPALNYYLHLDRIEAAAIVGNLSGMAAGRIARFFNLIGNALQVDTTCSSSLVAVHMACNDILHGEADQAIVCGARLVLFPSVNSGKSPLGISSPDGKDRAFSASANGTSTGEACGAVLLKPLQLAKQHGDNIHAVIKSSAVNQDANRSAFLTAPSKTAQTEVIRHSWAKAGIDPESISYVEAHGTGTRLGDPIEIDALTEAFYGYTRKKHFCAVSSVKTNIGHTDTAAGISGLLKATLSIKHKELFPSLHFDQPNPMIDFANSAVYVNDKLTAWEAGGAARRRAGVSAFGMSGTNCHVVLEEAPEPEHPANPVPPGKLLFTFSSGALAGLLSGLEAFAQYLHQPPRVPLADIGYTLNKGRKHHEYRVAITASSIEELAEALAEVRLQPHGTRGVRKIAKTPPAFVMFFPHEVSAPAGLVGTYAQSDAVFRQTAEDCYRHVQGKPVPENVHTFIFQYCLFRALEHKGLASRTLSGQGVGELVVSVILKEISLAQAMVKALDPRAQADASFAGRLMQYAERLSQQGNTVFLHVGHGPLGTALSEWQQENAHDKKFHWVGIGDSRDGRALLVNLTRELYLLGHPIQWNQFYTTGKHRRVELPTYQFEKERCWVKPALKPDVGKWLYELVWTEEPSAGPLHLPKDKVFLLFTGDNAVAPEIGKVLRSANNECVTVRLADRFKKVSSREYWINLAAEADYYSLKNALAEDRVVANGIIHLGSYANVFASDAASIEEDLQPCLYSQFYTAKVFSEQLSRKSFFLTFVSAHGQFVEGDRTLVPVHHLTTGFLKSLLSSYPFLRANSIDLEYGGHDPAAQAVRVLTEMFSEELVKVVAYRDRKRFTPTLKPLVIQTQDQEHRTRAFANNGTYIITGGATGIGLEVARYIAANYHGCHLIILGRRVFDSSSPAAAPGGSLHGLATLMQSCPSLTYYPVDVGDAAAMDQVFFRIAQQHPRITGVIHAAGLPGRWTPVGDSNPNDLRETLQPKVHGSLVLTACCRRFAPEYILLFSSLNSVVPQKNSAAYAVANAFLDAYSRAASAAGHTRVIAVNWPGWKEAGMGVSQNANYSDEGQPLKLMSTPNGMAVLETVLAAGKPNVLVAEVDTSGFVINPFFRIEQDQPAVRSDAPTEVGPVARAQNKRDGLKAPAGSVEETVARIFASVLKAEEVQATDDFFDLGGNSLNGTQVIYKIESEFGIQVEFEDLLENGTPAQLTKFIAGKVDLVARPQRNPIPALEEQEYYNVSHAQARLWVLYQFDENARIEYNISASYRVRNLQAAAFETALNEIIKRHESLRTVVITVNGAPKQQVKDYASCQFKLERIDLRDHPDQEAEAVAIARKMATTPFDLEKGPLFQAALIQLSGNHYHFVFCVHHIISDGLSIEIMANELYTLYRTICEGQSSNLPPLPIHYKDYTAWVGAGAGDEAPLAHEEYWLKQLAKPVPVLNLPADFPRPRIKTYLGASYKGQIEENLSRGINGLAKEHGATLFMVLLASLKALFYKYTGQEDLILGTPIAGRKHEDLEMQIGLYLNTLALRTQFKGDESFVELLKKVRTGALAAYQHQDHPFDQLVDKLGLERDLSRSPLFDVMIVLLKEDQASPENKNVVEELSFQRLDDGVTFSRYDLTFNFMEVQEKIYFSIEYNTDLFTAARIRKLADHLRELLSSIITNAHLNLDALNCLPREEVRQVVGQLADTAAGYPTVTIHELFEAQAQKTPRKTAVTYRDVQLTYQAVNERSNQLAFYLRRQYNVQPDDLVALVLDRSEALPMAILGVLKAGAGYVPIDADHPLERIRYVISSCRVKCAIVSGDLHAGTLGVEVINVVSDAATLGKLPAADLPTIAGAGNAAYVMHTSGSSGQPKGVLIEHGSVVNFLCSMAKWPGIEEADKLLAVTTYGFDISVLELVLPLVNGASLCIADRETVRSPEKLIRYMEDCQPTIMQATPSLWQVLIDHQWQGLKSLKMLSGGEKLPVELGKKLLHKGAALWNMYGPTETTIWSTAKLVKTAADLRGIGKPIDNTAIYVVDDALRLQPAGVPGEVCISGAGVARGYLNHAGLTGEKFLNDPFVAGRRLYRTGDVGFMDPDGQLVYIGRNDEQIKIRGHRVELAEIENVMRTHPGISNAAAVTHANDGDGKYLTVHYTAKNGADIDDLWSFAGQQLPDYMIPQYFIREETFPLTPNGKTDKNLLKKNGQLKHRQPKQGVLPRNETEQKLTDIWQYVLNVEITDVTANFFELGGHSLSAMQIVNQVDAVFNAQIRLKAVFMNPTIEKLSAVILAATSPTLVEADNGRALIHVR